MDERRWRSSNTASNTVYGLGFVGAAIYYIAGASSVLAGIGGFFKALVWPAFLVYHLFDFLGI